MAAAAATDFPTRSVTLVAPFDEGLPGPEHFKIVDSVVSSNIAEGEVLIKVMALSADPYMRGRFKTSGGLKPGQVIPSFVSGKIVASRNANWKVDDYIGGLFTLSTYFVANEKALEAAWKLTGMVNDETISYGIGVLGMPGSTAYGGLYDVLRPNQGETIFISAASGAVGALVGQLAKQVFNCKVIGSCGGPQKCAIAREKFGFDVAIDYKTCPDEPSLANALKQATDQKGIDMYFENVGGIHFEAAFNSLRPYGRIAVCGGISVYNDATAPKVSINPLQMIYTNQRIEGFLCGPWLYGKKGNFLPDVYKLLSEKKLVIEETFFDGIEKWPEAFLALFTGANVGKVVVRA